MLITLLAAGFLLGLRHALEADHVAAVAALATRRASARAVVGVAAAWGAGHAATLLVLGALLVIAGATVPAGVAQLLEGAVGLLLVALGVDVMLRGRPRRHDHAPVRGLAPRALAVGCVHGLAGTAGLLLLAVPAMESGARAVAYLLVFGLGTVAGMVGFSLLISVPLTWSARRLRRAASAFAVLCGAANVLLGLVIAGGSFASLLSI
jgi:hypothetical protein